MDARATGTSKQARVEGKRLRRSVARSSHAAWATPADRTDPLAVLAEQDKERLPELVPVRLARMAESPFAFLRGAAVVMARDLAATPRTGVTVQLCGDAHVANFGAFASPERRLLFDVDDFDETAPGPWEWDVKRLVTSAVVASRSAGHARARQRAVARSAAEAYHRHMLEHASMGALETWYSRVDASAAERMLAAPAVVDRMEAARRQASRATLPRLRALVSARRRCIVDHPPLVTHSGLASDHRLVQQLVQGYRQSLQDDRRVLLERFELVDFAQKVVGVGSVGTRCFIALLLGPGDEPLVLQVKEARPAAVTEVLGDRATEGQHHQGRRVVAGQRLMQAASDLFLGWASAEGRDYYLRQLRDARVAVDPMSLSGAALGEYAALCGWVLARAHARAGGPAVAGAIAGYLGTGSVFDDAVVAFSLAYAEQTEADHAALVWALHDGRIGTGYEA
ncbi:MAG: DUF2252 domain-containing protein [Acidimicrobiales bacterium]